MTLNLADIAAVLLRGSEVGGDQWRCILMRKGYVDASVLAHTMYIASAPWGGEVDEVMLIGGDV